MKGIVRANPHPTSSTRRKEFDPRWMEAATHQSLAPESYQEASPFPNPRPAAFDPWTSVREMSEVVFSRGHGADPLCFCSGLKKKVYDQIHVRAHRGYLFRFAKFNKPSPKANLRPSHSCYTWKTSLGAHTYMPHTYTHTHLHTCRRTYMYTHTCIHTYVIHL